MNLRKTIIVYRDDLLGPSETFIRAQAESLECFRAFYLGLRRIPGLALPEGRVLILSKQGVIGKVRRARFKLLGPSESLQQMLAAHCPAVVHAHFGPDACTAVSLARALGVPLVVTFHGYDVTVSDDLLPRTYIQRQNLLKRYGARFLCVSEFIRERVIAKGFPAEKTIVHYTGIDTDFFSGQPAISRSPVVLFVGRLVPKKGCEYLIRAMSRVEEMFPVVKLVVIGDGPMRQRLEKQAAAVLKNVHFLGVQEPTAVRDWMNRAMVFCTPSVTAESGDAEGFGMVFAEAQSMGLPVVSFASGGIPEVVAQDRTGFLVPEGDWEALAAKLLVLLWDRKLWSRFSEAGQDRVRKLFDIKKQAALLERIYESVLAEHSRGSFEVLSIPKRGLPADSNRSLGLPVEQTRD